MGAHAAGGVLKMRSGIAGRITGSLGIAILLAGCPTSATDSAPPEQTALYGYASDGFSPYDIAGVVGELGREVSTFAPEGATSYRLQVDQVQGPYLLRAISDGEPYHSVATGPGYANISLLTELVVADIFAVSPRRLYDALAAGDSPQDLSILTPPSIAEAERRVRGLLTRRLGLPVPAAIEDFFTTSAVHDGGDPMTQFQRTLQNRIVDDLRSPAEFVELVAQHARACRVSRLVLTDGADDAEFCPAGRSVDADPADATLLRHRFSEVFGDELIVRTRSDSLVDVTLTRPDGRTARCIGMQCSGATLGVAAADGTRRIELAAVALQGASGALVLDGPLQSGQAQAPEGGCIGEQLIVTAPDASRFTHCVGRRAVTPKLGRIGHGLLSLNDPGFVLELILDGDRVAWLLLASDPRLGGDTPFYRRARCIGGDCAGVTVSAPDSQGRRLLRFANTALQRTDAGGAVVPGELLLLDGQVRTGRIRGPVDPPACRQTDGSTPGVRLRVAVEGGGEQVICDNLAGAPRVTEHDDDGDGIVEALSFIHAGVATDAAVSAATMTVDHLRLDDRSAAFIDLRGAWINLGGGQLGLTTLAGCVALDCRTQGVTVQGAQGGYTVRLDGVALPERFPDGTPTGRTLRLQTLDP